MKTHELEKELGISKHTIFYYEKEGIITPQRDDNGYRSYSQDDLQKLIMVKFLRNLNISIDDVKAILNNELDFKECLEINQNQKKKQIKSLEEVKENIEMYVSKDLPMLPALQQIQREAKNYKLGYQKTTDTVSLGRRLTKKLAIRKFLYKFIPTFLIVLFFSAVIEESFLTRILSVTIISFVFINIFLGKWYVRTKWGENSVNKKRKSRTFKEFILNLIENIRHRFASYDTLMQLTPFSVFNIFRWLVVVWFMGSCYMYNTGVDVNFFQGGTYLAQALRKLFSIRIVVNPGVNALLVGLLVNAWFRILFRLGDYIERMWVAVYIFIIEHKNIKPMPLYKKVLYTLTWPTFDVIGRWTTYVALFMKVEWKPIPHDSKVTIDDITSLRK